VDAVWISPIFPSPMADFGYDVSNYTDIDPIFGTLAEFDALLADVHRRGMKLLLDYVPNHTSDQHPWFIDARSSRVSAKRDWYIWRDPAPDGGPPNNWRANFGGAAWAWDENTEQYYYHAFLKEQPDLNWRNPRLGPGRDPVRTPMQWSSGQWAEFSTVRPWLPVADDYRNANVELERTDASSLLSLYRRLIELRRAEPALSVGDYAALPAGDDLVAYMRKGGRRRLLIVLNFGARPRKFDLNELEEQAVLLLSTHLDREQETLGAELPLRPDEGVIVELS
jgi:glycosidase